MIRETDTLPRVAAAIIALAAFGALGLQASLNLERDGSHLAAAGMMLRYFTIWGNLAAAILMLRVALGQRVAPALLAALATALAIIGLVYWLLLAGMHHPVGLDRWTNQFHHTVVPVATIGWWLAFARVPRSTARALPVVMAGPVIYAVFALIVGAKSGFYAYFFLDRSTLEWGQVLINITGLAIIFAGLGAAMMALKRLVDRRLSRLA